VHYDSKYYSTMNHLIHRLKLESGLRYTNLRLYSTAESHTRAFELLCCNFSGKGFRMY